ncbi:MAG: Ig-like domain-containing protein [Candidatus Krumholzibacteria bacterium]|nr:Ig-like domain-containing protein [Candidatus Krumholzibacteria bacterium]
MSVRRLRERGAEDMSGKTRLSAGGILGALVWAALLAACAVQEPPPGGPEDRIPPSVVSTLPREDSARVARDVAPVFFFNEKVDPASFKNRVLVYPPVEFDRLRVKGERLEIDFRGLLPETTVCVLVRSGIRDYHRIESKRNFMLYFSTADSIARGQVSGVVLLKDKPDSAGVAELFEIAGDTAMDMRSAKRSRVAFAGRDGEFVFRALPTDGSRFLLRAFIDLDGDARYSEGKEFATLRPDTIALERLRPVRENIRIVIIDPNEPGVVEGRVVNETPFRTAPTVRLAPAARGAKWIAAQTDTTGAFMLSPVPPGSYTVSAFIDVKLDTMCGVYYEAADSTRAINEPCVTLPDTLAIKPGERRTLDPITLK